MTTSKTSPLDFIQACTRMLTLAGAKAAAPGSFYPYTIETVAGMMGCTPYDNWLACRFYSVEKAKPLVKAGSLNPFSGKWNWHYDKPTAKDLASLQYQIAAVAIAPQEVTEIIESYRAQAQLLDNTTTDMRLRYQYRDASNFKVMGEVNIRGGLHGLWAPLTHLQAALLLLDTSEDPLSFIPGQVGLPDLQDSFAGCESHWDPESDTPWHKLVSIEPIPEGSAKNYLAEDFSDFVTKLLDAALIQGWNEEWRPEFYPLMAERYAAAQLARPSG
jgi:hypothetical protein